MAELKVGTLVADGAAHVAAEYLINGDFNMKKTGLFVAGDFMTETMIFPQEKMDFLNRGEYPEAAVLEKSVYITLLQWLIMGRTGFVNKLIVNGGGSLGGYAYSKYNKQ